MKEKETKWNEFINANKTAYFESINNDEKKVQTFNGWSVQKQYLHLKRFVKAQSPNFKRDMFVKQTLKTLTKIKSELVISDELSKLSYEEYMQVTSLIKEVHELILDYSAKLKQVKKATLQKQLEKIQSEMKGL
ncbi:hypothetical protein [Bacteroides xylanisolvens]|jgi:hypothetical protein|uniref:hypothetical protein n=1 Tax=Bacteroides xylanisolvens TaxID=371601 RepID=UPI0022E91AE8|nr:hypothetical protein [Bacteroides xylanisolvens]